ncbi:class I glutamine amidotransferase-like protein [Parathielavia appendiculata]|uniref:Class I glutamine amidotransferase-like protein n=1 Tax=Parathielavia appendiculata TaxID=2587402 RepID=A0AAN6TUG4_9PEZI|nr:class I glutamine amidotransferase-like protein [Parathielavia appendiculata]
MSNPFKILIFSRTTAYRHESIPAGIRALHRLASASSSGPHPFTADDTEDASIFTPVSLAAYRVIVLLQCSGDILDDAQLDALKGFVRSGGGIVGVHCASFAMQSSEWYGRLIGGVFDNHPEPQPGRVLTLDPKHPIMTCRCSPDSLQGSRRDDVSAEDSERTWVDEWYNFKVHPRETSDGRLHVLLAVDEKSYKGGVHEDDHPVSWCQSFDGGRCFYTSLGHFDEAYEDDWFMGQILGGILWAAETS